MNGQAFRRYRYDTFLLRKLLMPFDEEAGIGAYLSRFPSDSGSCTGRGASPFALRVLLCSKRDARAFSSVLLANLRPILRTFHPLCLQLPEPRSGFPGQ